MKKSEENNHYSVGQEIYAYESPGTKLVVRRYIDNIYYCTIPGQPELKDRVYFERELIKPDKLFQVLDVDGREFNTDKPTALLFCDGAFGRADGNITNGLIRESGTYEIVGVVDKTKAGLDAGLVLDDQPNNIYIYTDIQHAIEELGAVPDYFVYGIDPQQSFISEVHQKAVLDAIHIGMNIINPSRELFMDNVEIQRLARQYEVEIQDIRRVPAAEDLHRFTGLIEEVVTPVISVFGTDHAVGKRTTANALVRSLRKTGLNVVFVATGQTGILQGAQYGAVIEVLSSGFAAGAVEHAILTAVDSERPDIIVVEGQGALSHPASTTSCSVLKGAQPDAIIMQHPPGRNSYCDYPTMRLPTLESEIALIEMFSESKVIAITLNHEHMNDEVLNSTMEEYEAKFKVPVTDVLKYGCDRLVEQVFQEFPEFNKRKHYNLL